MDNEKLKELAEKCIIDDQFAVGTFVSILIDECLLAVDSTAKSHVHTSFDQNQHLATIIEVKKAIKNHFGIK